MPDSAEMPAPVRITIDLGDSLISSSISVVTIVGTLVQRCQFFFSVNRDLANSGIISITTFIPDY
jgi:hypothetical protein